jgi:PPOX class probable F420-dependent enzyme
MHMQTLTPECKEFLLTQTRTGKLATARADGRPHVVPIWFTLDGDHIIFTTWHSTIKAANIRRDPRVCLCVDDEVPPFSYVQIEGTATIIDDLEALKHWATRLAGRYMGEQLAEAYGKRNGVSGELLVRITPTKVLFKQNIAD